MPSTLECATVVEAPGPNKHVGFANGPHCSEVA